MKYLQYSIVSVCCLMPNVATALPAGGAFAGPTSATGAALYWNPAALAARPAQGALLLEVTGLAFGASYQRGPANAADTAAYDPASFWGLSPDPSFALSYRLPFLDLHVVGGGFSPMAAGVDWPEGGAQQYHSTTSWILSYTLAAGLMYAPSDRFGLAALAGPVYYKARVQNAIDFGAFANAQLPPGAGVFALEDPSMAGQVEINSQGFGAAFILGAFVRPLRALQLGVGFVMPQDFTLHGDVELTSPAALANALPELQFAPQGKLEMYYPMPWSLNAEAALTLGKTLVAATWRYVRRQRQPYLLGRIYEAEPDFIEGRQVSIKDSHNEWMVGLRVGQAVSPELELLARVDYDTRYVPDEVLSPVNLDFETVELSAAARYKLGKSASVTLTYGYVHVFPIVVSNSLFNPRAPSDTGLSAPSANGAYVGFAHKLTLSFEGFLEAS